MKEKGKFKYLVNGKEVTRSKFKQLLSEEYADCHEFVEGLSLAICNYKKAENWIRRLQSSKCECLITGTAVYSVRRLNNERPQTKDTLEQEIQKRSRKEKSR